MLKLFHYFLPIDLSDATVLVPAYQGFDTLLEVRV